MDVSGITAGAYQNAAAVTQPKTAETEQKTETQTPAQQDAYVKGQDTSFKTYKPDTAKIAALNASQSAQVENLRTLVRELLAQKNVGGAAAGEQTFDVESGTVSGSAVFGGGINPDTVESYWDLLVDNGDGTFSLDPSLSADQQNALAARAQSEIGEDGYWGVKQTSGRILDFAKAITGGDAEGIATIRKVVEEAFGSVRGMMGGKLPQLSQDTYDAVMKGLDEWEASAKIGGQAAGQSGAAVTGAAK